ncbi:hypothetical protein HK100_010383 [Physocladia obscura]|uniref:Uncharacterized protein n=1 Tax=Physocladia obscura TaxID=109957 RepID=A0AAD5T2K3_9FUNG|nr:hypothetical protein HK100_010383 [Physocladia obscura]
MDDSPEARYLTVVIQMLEDLPEDDHFRVDILIVDAKRLLTTMILNNLQKAFEFDDNSDNELEYKPRKLSKINDTNLRRIRSSLLGIRALLLYFGKQQAAQNMLMLLAQEGLTAEDEVAQALLAVEPKLPDFYETGSLNTSDNNKILVNTAKDISQNFESDSRILLQQLTIYSHNKLGTPIINNTNESFVGTSKSNTDSKIMIRNNENIPDVLLQNSVVNKNAENILSELSYNENEHINIKWSKNQIEANSKKKIRLPLEQSRSNNNSIPAETTITYKNSNEIKRQSSENRNNMFELDNQNRTITSNIESSLSNDLMHEKRSSSAYERSINFPVRSIGAKLVNMDSQNTDFLETESVDSKIRCNSKADIEMKGTVKKTTFDNSIIFQRKNSSRQISPRQQIQQNNYWWTPIATKQLTVPVPKIECGSDLHFVARAIINMEALKGNPR